ncbi:cysteine-rich CWC family protein [Ideonella sp. DXS29W]|uniref:Cysteine-rich CWC family protein n=1 Tax=Ideonella lacteola TaxID=2984193 RepID=A0ABU9BTT2_9BURK
MPLLSPDPVPGLDRCPRCGGGFHCGAAGPAPCPCGTLKLSEGLQSALRQRYTGCLCLPCLQALSLGAPIDPPIDPPVGEAWASPSAR